MRRMNALRERQRRMDNVPLFVKARKGLTGKELLPKKWAE